MEKILQVHGGMNRAGTEAVIMGWYRNIDTNEIQFDFTNMTGMECSYDKEILERQGKIINVPSRAEVGSLKHCYYLYKCIKDNGPYIAVHSHMNFHGGIVAVVAKLAGVKKVVIHAHNTQDDGVGIKRKIEIFILRKLLLRFGDEFLACGKDAGNFLFGEKTKFEIINNSVDIDKFKPKNIEDINEIKKIYKLEGKIILGHIGRFSKQKNHKFIIKIIEQLKQNNIDAKFILIGDGELKDCFFKELEDKKLLDYVLYLGLRDNIDYWLNIIDIFIFPSLYEGLPVVLVESQATGVPCIISKNISPEVDLGMGLVTRLDIDDAKIWIDNIVKNQNSKIYDCRLIEKKLKENGYILKDNVIKLINIYKRKGDVD